MSLVHPRNLAARLARSSAPWALLLGMLAGCQKSKSDDVRAAAASAAPTGSIVINAMSRQKSPYASNRKYVPQPAPSVVPIPSGPRLAILAGKGVGPIRIGATVETIERHMALPCEVKTETRCRYIGRAVDFYLKDGVVDHLVVHRRDRPAGKDRHGKDRVFGIFNGGIPPDFQVMMKQRVIEEHLGPALRKESVAQPNPNNTIERHYYDGMVVEYDRYDNGQMVLGAVRIDKPGAAAPSPAASSGQHP